MRNEHLEILADPAFWRRSLFLGLVCIAEEKCIWGHSNIIVISGHGMGAAAGKQADSRLGERLVWADDLVVVLLLFLCSVLDSTIIDYISRVHSANCSTVEASLPGCSAWRVDL